MDVTEQATLQPGTAPAAAGNADESSLYSEVSMSWDGRTLAWQADGMVQLSSSGPDESLLPELPGEIESIRSICWPLERLAVRGFSLPLDDVKHLDAAILSQELSELTGEEEDDFWLAWSAGSSEQGIRGTVFGLPMQIKQAMTLVPAWNECPRIVIDGWERLNQLAGSDDTCAVIDEDAGGLFLGFRKEGVWRGIRRLNRDITDTRRLGDAETMDMVVASWQAMAMDESDPVTGRTGGSLAGLIQGSYPQSSIESLEELPERHQRNLECVDSYASGLNFRFGKWSVAKGWQGFDRWKRPLMMAAAVMLAWIGAAMFELHSLDVEGEGYRQRIESAFHRGLPEQKVMLDPLAQLRQASGGAGGVQGNDQFLKQLQLVAGAYAGKGWNLKELGFQNGKMQMSGSTTDIESLNHIRDRIQEAGNSEVVISDTDLSGERVTFRMKW